MTSFNRKTKVYVNVLDKLFSRVMEWPRLAEDGGTSYRAWLSRG